MFVVVAGGTTVFVWRPTLRLHVSIKEHASL